MAAKLGDAYCQIRLGYLYYEGDGVEEDIEQAVFWWKKAEEQGCPLKEWMQSEINNWDKTHCDHSAYIDFDSYF